MTLVHVCFRCFVIGGEDIYGSLHKLDVSALTARPSSGVAISNGGRVTCSDLQRVVDDVRATSGVTILTSPPDDACDDVYSDVVSCFLQISKLPESL